MAEFSICIPNFNYEKYLGITLKSVQEQIYPNFNVCITDNASTDNSVDVIKKYADQDCRFLYNVNTTNVGFAANLDKCGSMADKEWMIMLSSDDVMLPDALQEYNKFISKMPGHERCAFTSTFDKIDSEGSHISYVKGSNSLWFESDIDRRLTMEMGCNVYKVESSEMLRRCIQIFYNPFNFAATCFLRDSYQTVNGYGGGRVYNPDKWFHWKIMTVTDYVYFIDKPLFQYRWHQQNQQAIEKESDVLKFWYDEYRNCFEIDNVMLEKVGMKREDVIKMYCKHLIKYVFAEIKANNQYKAKRLLNWGCACYPKAFRSDRYYQILSILSALGFAGCKVANLLQSVSKK